MTLQPLSQSCLTEMREECANPGTIWAWVASSPSPGRLRLPTWVDLMTSPSGNVMWRGLLAFRLLTMGTFGRRKWAVAPESMMASVLLRRMFMLSAQLLTLLSVDRDDVDAVASSELWLQLLVMTVLSSSSSNCNAILFLTVGIG